MAKLCIAVVPNSECEKHVVHCMKTFGRDCQTYECITPGGKDANYYMLDCKKFPGLEDVLLYNFENGKYSEMSFLIAHDPLAKFVYGLYEAKIMSDDYTIEEFIK